MAAPKERAAAGTEAVVREVGKALQAMTRASCVAASAARATALTAVLLFLVILTLCRRKCHARPGRLKMRRAHGGIWKIACSKSKVKSNWPQYWGPNVLSAVGEHSIMISGSQITEPEAG